MQTVCNCDLIEQFNEIKYLGFIGESRVSCNSHIKELHLELRKLIQKFYFFETYV